MYLFGSSPPIIFTILITGLFFWKTHLKIAGSHIQMVFKKCTNCHTILCSRKKIYRMGDKFVLRDGLDDSSIPPLDLFAGVSMLLLAWQINDMLYSSLFFKKKITLYVFFLKNWPAYLRIICGNPTNQYSICIYININRCKR